MKKVVYSIKRTSDFKHNKITGIGYITDTDLIIACNGKNQKAYIGFLKIASKIATLSLAKKMNSKVIILKYVKLKSKPRTVVMTQEKLNLTTLFGSN